QLPRLLKVALLVFMTATDACQRLACGVADRCAGWMRFREPLQGVAITLRFLLPHCLDQRQLEEPGLGLGRIGAVGMPVDEIAIGLDRVARARLLPVVDRQVDT